MLTAAGFLKKATKGVNKKHCDKVQSLLKLLPTHQCKNQHEYIQCTTFSVNLSINSLAVMSVGGLGMLMDIIICFNKSAAFISPCNVFTDTVVLSLPPPHTHPFNGPFSGTTQVSWYQKGKTNLDFTEARDNEWQWHKLGHMQVCTLLQTDNHTSTPPLSFLQAGCPSCSSTNSIKALKALVLSLPINK